MIFQIYALLTTDLCVPFSVSVNYSLIDWNYSWNVQHMLQINHHVAHYTGMFSVLNIAALYPRHIGELKRVCEILGLATWYLLKAILTFNVELNN